jgi:hypothetical protein
MNCDKRFEALDEAALLQGQPSLMCASGTTPCRGRDRGIGMSG